MIMNGRVCRSPGKYYAFEIGFSITGHPTQMFDFFVILTYLNNSQVLLLLILKYGEILKHIWDFI